MATPRQCARIGCTETRNVNYDKPLCYPHWKEFDSRRLFECERCHRFDELVGEFSEEPLCWNCVRGEEVPEFPHGPVELREYWLYILKLDGGQFYVGQCNDLEIRMKEHRDGTTASTRGKNLKLVWFRRWPLGRGELLEEEREMQRWVRDYPRQARRMIADWQRLIRLVDVDS